MNEFTKEELKHLFDELTWLTELYEEPEIMYTIKDKIEAMIKNYCEHEFEIEYSPYHLCKKCKVKR